MAVRLWLLWNACFSQLGSCEHLEVRGGLPGETGRRVLAKPAVWAVTQTHFLFLCCMITRTHFCPNPPHPPLPPNRRLQLRLSAVCGCCLLSCFPVNFCIPGDCVSGRPSQRPGHEPLLDPQTGRVQWKVLACHSACPPCSHSDQAVLEGTLLSEDLGELSVGLSTKTYDHWQVVALPEASVSKT